MSEGRGEEKGRAGERDKRKRGGSNRRGGRERGSNLQRWVNKVRVSSLSRHRRRSTVYHSHELFLRFHIYRRARKGVAYHLPGVLRASQLPRHSHNQPLALEGEELYVVICAVYSVGTNTGTGTGTVPTLFLRVWLRETTLRMGLGPRGGGADDRPLFLNSRSKQQETRPRTD